MIFSSRPSPSFKRSAHAAAVAVCLSAVVAACGGEDKPLTEKQQIAKVVRDFNSAFAAGDGGRTCKLITDSFRDSIELAQGKPCPAAVEDATRPGAPEADDIATLRDADVSNVQIVGEDGVATADVTGPDVPGGPPAQCQKQDGKWLVSATSIGTL